MATLPCAKNGWLSTSTPASITHGLVVRSVHAGTAPKPELGQQQGAGALGGDQLPRWIEADARHQRRVGCDVTRLHAAADDNCIGVRRLLQRRLGAYRDAVHGGDGWRRAGRRTFQPARLTVEDAEGNERIQLVEAVEGAGWRCSFCDFAVAMT